LIERGTCGFALKARNATNAGASGVIIYNNLANAGAAPPSLGDDGVNGAFVTIPTVSIIRAGGLAIVGALGSGVTGTLRVDLSVRAGADALGRARLYAPFPVAAGSSISHFDTVAFRNLLMEPAINGDLTHNVKAPDDLTLELLRDVGWFADADLDGVADEVDCSPNSDLRPTVIIDGCDSSVPNTLFSNGCTVSDLITQIGASSLNHGAFVSEVSHLTNELKKSGLISGSQKAAIESCAAGAKTP
jgi:PA domain